MKIKVVLGVSSVVRLVNKPYSNFLSHVLRITTHRMKHVFMYNSDLFIAKI